MGDFAPMLIMLFGSDLFCTTQAMIKEDYLGGEKGMLAVALVIDNRTERDYWPDSPCKVVYEPSKNPRRPKACAFSYTCDKKPDIVAYEDLDMYYKIMPKARAVLEGEVIDFTKGADHYVRCDVNVSWKYKMEFTLKLGDHCFYREGKRV